MYHVCIGIVDLNFKLYSFYVSFNPVYLIIAEMGKNNKKGPKANVFKVAGAKSLKKTKAKAVNLGLKNIKQKVQEIDKEFVEMSKQPKTNPKPKSNYVKAPQKRPNKNVIKEEVAKTAEEIVKMDL